MAKDQTRPPSRAKIDHARKVLVALQTLQDYEPVQEHYSTSALLALDAEAEQARQAEIRARTALAKARSTKIAAQWALHNAILGAKAQVIAQYGDDSDAVRVIGFKKKSERKRPSRRAASVVEPV